MEIAKAGWINRRSTVLRRWKRSWLVLYQNGHLAYFESPDKHEPDEIVILPGRLAALRRATEIVDFPAPPEGRTMDTLIQLLAGDGEEMLLFSAENSDDAAAWHIALDQARVSRPTAPAGYLRHHQHQQSQQPMPYPPPQQQYGGYPPPQQQYGYPPGQHVQYVQQPPTTIIIERDPYCYGYGGYGYPYGYYDPMLGVGMGAMTGLALGSMMGMGWGWGGGCW